MIFLVRASVHDLEEFKERCCKSQNVTRFLISYIMYPGVSVYHGGTWTAGTCND